MKTKLLVTLLPVMIWGCSTSHQIDSRSDLNVKPIEIKPIHITIDINVKVDRALDDFFDDVDSAKTTKAPEPTKTPEAVKAMEPIKTPEPAKAPETVKPQAQETK
ncbi:MAG: hypothetical protein WC071_10100 [Victivallaceae bacterium]